MRTLVERMPKEQTCSNDVSIRRKHSDANWRAHNLVSLATWGVRESEFRDNDVKLRELVVRRDDMSLEIAKAVAIPVLMNSVINDLSWL
jgi:hypothetical protein